jgi:hypothetical protein
MKCKQDYYLDYERGKENHRDWDAPARYKIRWVKKKAHKK